MARPLRIEYPGAFYHVMNRGACRKPIFFELKDKVIFLNVLEYAVELLKVNVHSYSLMNNHYHLLLETPLGNLSRVMRHLDGVYTQRINRKYGRDGSLMRGRYKSILVEKESYLLELTRYIHLNGVRAGLYRTPKQDKDTSHRRYLGLNKKPEWLTTEVVLSSFASKINTARGRFDAFVREGADKDLVKTLVSNKWPAILGTDKFTKKIKKEHLKDKPLDENIPQMKPLQVTATPDDIIRQVCKEYQKDPEVVLEGKKRNLEARKALMYLLRHHCLLTYAEIGRRLGGVGYGAVAKVCLGLSESLKRQFETLLKDKVKS